MSETKDLLSMENFRSIEHTRQLEAEHLRKFYPQTRYPLEGAKNTAEVSRPERFFSDGYMGFDLGGEARIHSDHLMASLSATPGKNPTRPVPVPGESRALHAPEIFGQPYGRKVIVGLAGGMGSGKTTLCNFLVQEYGAVKTSFADPLKKMLEVLGLTKEQLWGNEKHIPDQKILLGQTPRHAMQTLGTEWGRQLIHPDIWAAAWKAMLAVDQPTFTVIEDVRFDNEVDAIRSLGGRVIALERGAVPERERRAFWRFGQSEPKSHASEDIRGLIRRKGLRVVGNDGSVEETATEIMREVR